MSPSLRFACFLLASLSCGCINLMRYQEPVSGPRARVRFSTETSGVTVLYAYDGEDCQGHEEEWMRMRLGTFISPVQKRLGMPLWLDREEEQNASREVYVTAGKPIYGLFNAGVLEAHTHTECAAPFTATFDEGGDYEVVFSWPTPMECQVVVSRLVPAGKDNTWARLAVRRFSNAVSETSRCQERFRKVRAY